MDFDALELLLQASLPVQLILAILIIASITSWVLIFEKYFTLARSTDASHEIEDKFWEGEKIEELYLSLKEKDLSDLEPSELILVSVYDSLMNKNDSANNVESTERLVRVIVNLSLIHISEPTRPY